ncbi:MAG: dihydroneopterin aldolase family protein [Methanomicrobiales archaeon]|jgi:hypothetical protein|nr:dihydroneopterin aldolase family protein [Methanomicrobiales archaeon]
MISDRDKALFEAGIKLGALYHQWVGTPVSKHSAELLETAIEEAHIQQPFVESISVSLDKEIMNHNTFGYSELSGLMFSVSLQTKVNNVRCTVELHPEDNYPMMKIIDINEES